MTAWQVSRSTARPACWWSTAEGLPDRALGSAAARRARAERRARVPGARERRRHHDPHGTPDWALGAHQPADREGEGDPGQRRRARAAVLDAARPAANLPGAAANAQILQKIVDGLQGSPGAVRLQGRRRAAQPFRGREVDRPAGLVRAHTRIKALDPKHPLVIIQAPRGPVSQLMPYRPAFDITGVDIFPVAYPPGCIRQRQPRHQRRRRHGRTRWTRRAGASRSG